MSIELYNEYVTPAELTGYARAALADRPENQFQLLNVLPSVPVNDLNYRFSRGSGAGLIEAASFRSFDAEPDFGRREGISRSSGELPAIGKQYLLGEYDQLRLRNADQEVRDLLLRDAIRIARQIEARFEFARGQALVEGKVTLAEGGVFAEVDFGRNAAHSVVPAVLWSDHAASTPIDDLLAWVDVYVGTNGYAPGRIQTSTVVLRHLAQNAQIIGMLYPQGTINVGRVPMDRVNDILVSEGLPTIELYDAQAINTAGTSARIIPADKLLFLPPVGVELGSTLWGVTLESQEAGYGVAQADQAGIVVGAFKQVTTPIRVFTIGAAIGLPIVVNPDATLVADVA